MALAAYSAAIQNVSISGAITLLQVKAGAAALDIIRVEIGQANSSLVAANMQRVQLLRKSVAATVTSFTPVLHDAGSAVSLAVGGVAATGTNATVEGNDSTLLWETAFHLYNGYVWVPNFEERVRVPQAGIIALKLPAAPPTPLAIEARITWIEYI